MTLPKYPRGTRVEILSRRNTPDRQKERIWENSFVGHEAIVISILEFHRFGNNDTDIDAPGYELLIFNSHQLPPRSCDTFEERFLELVCSNVAKGEVLLEKYKDC